MTRPDQSQTRPARRSSFLRRLASDTRGNTLAIVGAALVPLTGMIGSGVDISRAYMAKTRLQTACDAGVLAGRRVMTQDTVGKTVRDEAARFFFFNFPVGVYGSNPIAMVAGEPPTDGTMVTDTFAVWRSAQGTVAGRANTALPTGVMHLFGFDTMDVEVECQASHDFNNIDIMLVLDVTGSMGCAAADSVTACSTYASNTYFKDEQNYVVEKSNSRMKALRTAVLGLYDQLAPVQAQLEANNLRLRYGILPYSSGVNVGRLLLDDNPTNILGSGSSETWRYRSRANSRTEIDIQDAERNWCDTTEDAVRNVNKCSYFAPQQRTFNVSQYVATLKNGGTIDAAGLVGGAAKNTRWFGCVEERATDSRINGGSGTNYYGAMDMDIDLVPTGTEATRWKPYFPRIMYSPLSTKRNGMGNHGRQPQVACPAAASALASRDRGALKASLDALLPTGGTYHDNGMRWGARMISDAGVFGHSPLRFNNRDVEKHIIFMTDGTLDTGGRLYSTYGLEQWDQRVSGTYTNDTPDLDTRHTKRFELACNAAKGLGVERGGRGVTIWTIVFASTQSAEMRLCAQDQAHAVVVQKDEDLKTTFEQIGRQIGALRISG